MKFNNEHFAQSSNLKVNKGMLIFDCTLHSNITMSIRQQTLLTHDALLVCEELVAECLLDLSELFLVNVSKYKYLPSDVYILLC